MTAASEPDRQYSVRALALCFVVSVAVGYGAATVVASYDQSRPVLQTVAKLARLLLWGAAFLERPPVYHQEHAIQAAPEDYAAVPPRPLPRRDGEELIDHARGW